VYLYLHTLCRIEKLIAQVPVERLNVSPKLDGAFEYLPKLTSHAPYLQHLALQVTRKDGSICLRDAGCSYNALTGDIVSPSVKTLIIDTADIDHAVVRKCPNDNFENISPLTSLQGFSNRCHIVAPQEAFVCINSSRHEGECVKSISPTTLMPSTIEKVEIIDSTTALNS
jgi:hypothetical protein